jgi:hypothetical protein
MARNRFPTPAVERLPLSEGDWIEVKRELNVGEEKDIVFLAMREIGQDDGNVRFRQDYQLLPFATAVIFLVSWSFHNAKGPVKLEDDQKKRLAQLRALEPGSWNEIEQAIKAHEEKTADAKKSQGGSADIEMSSASAAPSSGVGHTGM